MSRFWLPRNEEGSRFGEDKVAHAGLAAFIAVMPAHLGLPHWTGFAIAVIGGTLWETLGAIYAIKKNRPEWRASWLDLMAFYVGASIGGLAV